MLLSIIAHSGRLHAIIIKVFMKRSRTSIDGFVPRRGGAEIGAGRDKDGVDQTVGPLHTTADGPRQTVGQDQPARQLGQTDLAASLSGLDEIDQPRDEKKLSRRERKRLKKERHKKSKWRRIVKWVGIGLLVLVLAVAGYLAYRFIENSGRVFQGNIFELVQNEPLREDENGRSNFLVFGTAEDDEGGTHDGGNLTDSIMVISVDQDKNDAYMISLPRDLWVEYQEICTVGMQGKINAAYFCASNDGQDEAAGAEALMAKAGEVTGLDMHYYVHLNFTAVVDAVDAVGGVDVTIPDYDPNAPGILDRNFDWKCNYQCYYVNYQDGEEVHMDGEHALAFARARNASGGYGLPQGNFNREMNQQLIIEALREKALSVGTLTNLGAVTGLLDAMGNNLRTNIQTKEIQTLMRIGTDIDSANINSISLVDEENMMVTTDSYNGQSIVRPIAGLLDYSQIHAYVNREVNASPVIKEDPHVSVLNGGRAAGVAASEAEELEYAGFTIDVIDNAPDGNYDAVEIYQITAEGKDASAAKLAEIYGVTVKTTAPPTSVVGETDFLVILGPEAN